MAQKKNSNYIGFELEWLEKRCRQLMTWCEEKLEGGITDRIHEDVSTRGNPIIKVISSEETQVKTLRDTLKELPSMLIEINRLRKVAGEDSNERSVRGEHAIPGFMEEDDEEEKIEKPKAKPKGSSKTKSPKTSPKTVKKILTADLPIVNSMEDDGDFEEP